MIISINQPAYLPWSGYFHRIAASDLHIVLDNVQFEKNSFTNRNKIRASSGWSWLSVPVKTKGRFGDLSIRSVEIDNSVNWRGKHWKSIWQSYSKAHNFQEHVQAIESIYSQDWSLLSDLCSRFTDYLINSLGITTPLVYSSDIDVVGKKDELVLELCRTFGATTYLSGTLGRDYLNEDPFTQAGIKVVFQDYKQPVYPQLNAEFVPNLSVIDLLFNCGPDALEILSSGQPKLSSEPIPH